MIEIDCRKCANLSETCDSCKVYGPDCGKATRACIADRFKNYKPQNTPAPELIPSSPAYVFEHDKEEYFCNEFRCPVCDTFLASYTYGRAWTKNGLSEERRPTSCPNCGQRIDWSGVPYPPKTEEAQE